MLTEKDTQLIARRRALLGATYRLFYDEPVHLVRGDGVWLYDAQGKRYLDAYNNVPAVGHCHPHVVSALARQAAILNTHTRYITDTPLQLAERVLATMPIEVDNLVFVCSGSEANELALRIAKFVTGGKGVIISQNAYHGTTELLSGMSPSSRVPLGPNVYTVAAPVGKNGPAEFGARVRECVAKMKADGVNPAALIVDTVFSSDGIISNPAGFLAAAADEIRKAGGLFIADEVQAGYGRTGAGMWGFARHGIVPDLVTMGKPMGNGHPLAATAVRSELMDKFSRHTGYFNTFGGNTVSCAVGLAVLDVIENEKLIENARLVGQHLRSGLEALAGKFPVLQNVRGVGLYCSVDIRDPKAESGRAAAAKIVNALRDKGVLLGATGPDGDALKIRPPLPFSRENSTLLVKSLEEVLSA